ncbi:mechanosensitive ion channel protein MscS [Niabella ginsenosidivorans]|uniref:Mechanosensitive ion channel protein MscS n=2 Tax=Niabella ginsenosidivorans TaxID=1176587 RepID=A0A1A9IAR9_9BACT|nr:mechanosensitive ion channel protein MscS [Niabella ginsenosidivorans]
MSEFLNQVYFNNSVRAYLIVGITILVVFLFKKYIALYVAKGIFKLVRLRYKNINLPTFLALVAKPLGLFLAVLVTVGALDKLKLPDELDFNIYRVSFQELLGMIGSFLVIFTFFRLIIKSIDFIMLMIQGHYLQTHEPGNHQLVFFFKDLIKVIIGIIGGLFILKYTFKYDIKGLVTGLSIVGAAVALALKESLENLIASFIIFFDRPFATGDAVKLNDVSGTVEKIGLRSTRIRSDAKSYITVPNKQMVDSVLDNQSDYTQRKASLKLEISSSTPADVVEKLLTGIREILTKEDIIAYTAFVNNITANAIVIACDYFTGPDITTFNKVRERSTLAILSLMAQLNITTAQSVSDIKIVQGSAPPPQAAI